jgi:biotin carboxyl carrier protein
MIIKTVCAALLLAALGCSDPQPARPANPDKEKSLVKPAAQVASVCQPGQRDCGEDHDEHGDEGHAKKGKKDHDEHGDGGNAKEGKKDHDEHGDEAHAKEGEKGHAEHGEKGHAKEGEKGHDEHGEEEGHDEHEEGTVELSPEAAARVDIAVAPVEERDLAGELLTTAEVGFDQDRRVHVAPRAAGRVHEVKVTLGQSVKAGDVLAIIDSTEVGRVKAEYLQARARLALASETLTRERKLAAEQLSAQREVASARTEVSELRSSLLASTQILRLYGLSDADIAAIRPGQDDASLVTLVSPLDGKVIERHANRASWSSPTSACSWWPTSARSGSASISMSGTWRGYISTTSRT